MSPTIPGYESLTLIGKGGFSRVYQGEQSTLRRQVAIKVLNFGLNDDADRRSFERETQLMARVSSHPNIVTVHDTAFTTQGQPCIVMEQYGGGSLARLITESGSLSASEAVEVGVAIAAALDASHQAGILHCDLKPQNILISDFGQPALGDFGISTFAEERTRTGGGASGFTLAYAAPEIVEGASPTAMSDVYSLAATLYTALAGRRPFHRPGQDQEKLSAAEQARRILLEEPASLVGLGVPEPLDRLIRKAMAKDPSQRPESASAFALGLYQVGLDLGFTTAPPRLVDRVPIGTLDTGRAEVHDADDATASRQLPSEKLREEPRAGASKRRRRRAVAIGLVGAAALVAVLFVAGRGQRADRDSLATAPTAEGVNLAVDPVLAPDSPADVTVERVDDRSLLVNWVSDPAEDVVYEIRVQGREGAYSTDRAPAVVETAQSDENGCATVIACALNRVSAPSGWVCAGLPDGRHLELEPKSCPADACVVNLSVTGDAADTVTDQTYAVQVSSLDGTFEWTATESTLELPRSLAAGPYLVSATTGGQTYRALLEVTEAEAP